MYVVRTVKQNRKSRKVSQNIYNFNIRKGGSANQWEKMKYSKMMMRRRVASRKNQVRSVFHSVYKEKFKWIEILIQINEPIKKSKSMKELLYVSE